MLPEIIFEDNSILVINKPAGLMVERDRHGNPNVEDWVEKYYDVKRVSQNTIIGIVHRIDRPVSGVLLIAKKKSVLQDLSRQFEENKVDKIYFAVTEKKPDPEEAHLQHFLAKDVKNKRAIIYKNKRSHAVKCELIYKYISTLKKGSLLEIHLITGKYHQIRAQLAFMNFPVVGDEKYGSVVKYKQDAIMLHSYSLEFFHPVEKRKVKFECDYPDDWNV